MPKVELDKIRLGKSAITDHVYAGIPSRDKQGFTSQTDVTNDFLKAVVERFGGYETVITVSNGQRWKLRCTSERIGDVLVEDGGGE